MKSGLRSPSAIIRSTRSTSARLTLSCLATLSTPKPRSMRMKICSRRLRPWVDGGGEDVPGFGGAPCPATAPIPVTSAPPVYIRMTLRVWMRTGRTN